jgi:ABC-type sugar transport system substrate-binding protein
MSFTRRFAGPLAAAALAALAIAGCGSSSSSSSSSANNGSGTKSTASADAPKVSDTRLQALVDEAMSSHDVKAASLPPYMRAALTRAAQTLTPAQLDKAFECWKATSCTIGNGPITLGQADPFGGNTWRQFTKMNIILQALTHPEVGKYIYTDANYNLAAYQANLRTMVAKGAKAIVTINEFGPAANAALANAQRQGAKVATYVGAMEDAPANAYTTRVQYDLCASGTEMADTVKKATSSSGPVAFLEGLPGAPSDAKMKGCINKAGVPTTFSDTTGYTAAGTQKAASALIASGKPVKAILYTYANTVPSIVNAYKKAGKQVPPIITTTQANATACQRAQDPYPLYITNSANWAGRISVDAAVDAVNGKSVPKVVIFPLPYRAASDADCTKGKPAEYPGPTLVPTALADKMLAGK